jgi:formiminotetrahydrofolate cyclodeaminase
VRVIGDDTLEAFAARVAARTPAPGGGACAAVACALAAALVEMAAGLTLARPELGDRHARMDDIARRAAQIRPHALALADRDGAVYAAVIEARARPAGAAREQGLAAALSAAADVPLEIAELGAELTALAGELQRDGNPNLSGDAAVASQLGAAATAGAARLVAINLHDRPDDPRLARARAL